MIKVSSNKPVVTVLSYIPIINFCLNDFYYRKIEDKRKSIDFFLKNHKVSVKEIIFTDCAPCEIEFSVLPNAKRGLKSFDFYMMLVQAKRTESIDVLKHECRKCNLKGLEKNIEKHQF